MAYKTIMLRIVRPSAHKRQLMDEALTHYSQALQALLSEHRDDLTALAASGRNVTRAALLAQIDRDAVNRLNSLNIQPFKDSLKLEFAMVAATFIAQRRKNPGAGYPVAYLSPEQFETQMADLIARLDAGKIGQSRFVAECGKLQARVGRLHPLYFGRYAENRDYCLLYDEFTGRFYAKLTLLNSACRELPPEGLGKVSLRYVAPGKQPLLRGAAKRKYIVVPLAFGKSQLRELNRALDNPALLHTARLIKKGEDYYLMANMECAAKRRLITTTTMGVARNASGGLSYTVCDDKGAVVASGRIHSDHDENQILFAFSKSIVRIALKYQSQVIVEADGGKNDEVLYKKKATAAAITTGQYAALVEILQYKLPEKRLPPPTPVSANGLCSTCPECESRSRRNCLSSELFACVQCGYATEAELVGSINLAKRLMKYRNDKVPVYVREREESLVFYNKALSFECCLPRDSRDYMQMYYELNRLVHSASGYETDRRKYAILKKLRESPNMQDAVRLVYRQKQHSRML